MELAKGARNPRNLSFRHILVHEKEDKFSDVSNKCIAPLSFWQEIVFYARQTCEQQTNTLSQTYLKTSLPQ